MDDGLVTKREDNGLIFYDSLRIMIRIEGQADQNIRDTFFHELQHAVWFTCGLHLEETVKEEDVIARSTPVWLQVFQDNPMLSCAVMAIS